MRVEEDPVYDGSAASASVTPAGIDVQLVDTSVNRFDRARRCCCGEPERHNCAPRGSGYCAFGRADAFGAWIARNDEARVRRAKFIWV